MNNISVERTKRPKAKPDENNIGFGEVFTDHMLLMNYEREKGWSAPRIVPYGPFVLDPATMVFHYAQEVFEGLKAYRTPDGSINLFRPWDNIRRLNVSNERLCIPQVDEDAVLSGLMALVDLDRDWVPTKPGTSLYIRPFIFATDVHVGVHASDTYIFAIIMSPVGQYYKEGINPVKIYVEERDVRAVRGGTGYIKTGGNYASSLRAGEKAKEYGFTQVLWLDGVHRKYIEEVGTMNVLFKIKGEIVTPALEGSTLDGITRRSCLDLARSWGIPVSERRISIEELFESIENGELEEAFGSGTAAVVSPIGSITWEGKTGIINNGEIGPITNRLYQTLTGIQWGTIEDTFGWTIKV